MPQSYGRHGAKGTQYVRFTMKDLEVRSYKYGGGVVKMSEDGTVPSPPGDRSLP